MDFVKDLGIQQEDKLTIHGEEASVKSAVDSYICVHIQGTDLPSIKKYCIENIAQLLMLQSTFANQEIQKKIETIREKDKDSMQTRKELYSAIDDELLGEGKPYLIHDGCVWHSSGVIQSKDGTAFWPSATLITEDVLGFKPINEKFSIDSSNVYCEYRQVLDKKVDHIVDNFLSDGENIYFFSRENIYNLTDLFKLESGEELSKISENTYQIGERFFSYNELDGIVELGASDETESL